jgi:PadR family transcriptional regulator PadR
MTAAVVDVLSVLVQAYDERREVNGWQIISAARRSGAAVYGALDNLEDVGWVEARWDPPEPNPAKPRRRLYTLTGAAARTARDGLAELPLRTPRPRPALGASLLRTAS